VTEVVARCATNLGHGGRIKQKEMEKKKFVVESVGEEEQE
jgi:hypothetical protein